MPRDTHTFEHDEIMKVKQVLYSLDDNRNRATDEEIQEAINVIERVEFKDTSLEEFVDYDVKALQELR